MKSIIGVCLVCLIITGCQQKASKETASDSTMVVSDTAVLMNSEKESAEAPSTGFHGTSLDLEALDSTLQNVLAKLHEPGKLNSLLHPEYGCYLITEGADR